MIVNLILNFIAASLGFLGFRGIHCLATIFAVFWFDILRIRRDVILKNLDIAFGSTKSKEEKIKIGRKSIYSFLYTAFTFLAAKKLFPKMKVGFSNQEKFDELRTRGMGLYAICIHMGNWEFLCHAACKYLVPIHIVAKPIGKGTLATWVTALRRFLGYRLIDRGGKESAATQIFNALNKQGVIGFITDQKRPNGETLPFFGKEASTNNSLAKLWLRKKAPVIPVIIKRTALDTYDVIFFQEFEMQDDKNLSIAENVTENTRRMNLVVEEMIRKNPEEYFWLHKRWG